MTLPPFALALARPLAGGSVALPIPRISSTANPMPAIAAATRWPRIVSTIDSVELTPTTMMTNRKSISTAPV